METEIISTNTAYIFAPLIINKYSDGTYEATSDYYPGIHFKAASQKEAMAGFEALIKS